MFRVSALLLTGLAVLAHAQPSLGIEARKIEYLITAVRSLQGATFFRNGKAYDSVAAADHLRTKWRMAGSHVQTAEDFIRECASASSVSGTPYSIHFADGHMVMSAQFLREKLSEYKPIPESG
jgi:hypothetical protein